MQTTKELLTRYVTNWQTAEFQDVEVAIALLYQLGEALPVSFKFVRDLFPTFHG